MWSSSTPKTSAGAAWHVPKPSFNHVEGQTGNKDTAPQDYNALKHAVRNKIKPLLSFPMFGLKQNAMWLITNFKCITFDAPRFDPHGSIKARIAITGIKFCIS